jgi:hypothetical protein
VIIFRGKSIDLFSVIPINLGIDGGVISIKFVTYKYLLRIIPVTL